MLGIKIEPVRVEALTRRIAFADETFYVVAAMEVIKNITELVHAVDEIRRVLPPNAALGSTSPHCWFPFEARSFTSPGVRSFRCPPFALLRYLAPLHRRIASARNFTRAELGAVMSRHELERAGVGCGRGS